MNPVTFMQGSFLVYSRKEKIAKKFKQTTWKSTV